MSIKILLADDSITIQKVVSLIFGGEEYCLTVVDNGKAAMDEALLLPPDIMIVDSLMPALSGYEVCETIRANPKLAHIPILLLTGAFEPLDEARAESCGADDFLAKPFESQQILGKVQELLALGASRAPAALQPEPQILTPSAPALAPVEPVEMTAFDANDIWNAFTPAPSESAPAESTSDPMSFRQFGNQSQQTPSAESTSGSPSISFTEEQLRAAISSVSRDVIERIVWEVVPGLAENLIKDAIGRITGAKGQGDAA